MFVEVMFLNFFCLESNIGVDGSIIKGVVVYNNVVVCDVVGGSVVYNRYVKGVGVFKDVVWDSSFSYKCGQQRDEGEEGSEVCYDGY